MGRVLNTLISIFFWWMLFLLLLIFGFNIQIADIVNNVFSHNIHFSIICILLLASPVLYIIFYILEFINDRKDGLFILDTIGLTFLPYFWVIYKGFDFRDFEFTTWIYNLFNNIVWWGLLAYGIWAIAFTNQNNIIISRIMEYNNQQVLIRFGVFLLACLVLYGIGRLLFYISGEASRNYMD